MLPRISLTLSRSLSISPYLLLLSSSLLLRQFPAYLVPLISMVCCFVWCCFQNMFNITRSILVQFPSIFFSVSVHLVHIESRINRNAAWKKLRIILSDRLDFHVINSLSITIHACSGRILMSLAVDETLLPKYLNLSTNFGKPLFRVKMSPWCTSFCLHSRGDQWILLVAPDYAAEIRLRLVY